MIYILTEVAVDGIFFGFISCHMDHYVLYRMFFPQQAAGLEEKLGLEKKFLNVLSSQSNPY